MVDHGQRIVHILFLTPGFPPFKGGGERYAGSLARVLAARGHSVTVATSQARSEQAFWQGTEARSITKETQGPVTVIRLPIRPIPFGRRGLLAWRKSMVLLSMLPGQRWRLLGHMARFVPPLVGLDQVLAQLPDQPDVVHGFNISWEFPLLAGWQYARHRNLPYVVMPFTHLGESRRARVARNSTMDHQRQVLEGADAVLALTSVEAQGFADWNIHPRHVVVAGGGVEPPAPGLDATTVLKSHGLKQPFALFVGRVNYDKGAIHAAQATLYLAQAGQPITLVLAGRISEDFDRFWRTLTPDQQALLRPLGVVGEDHKHALLQEATVLLLPSRADSFGIVLLEAWQHGTPVIGARAGGIPGVIDEGHNGLLVPFGDVKALARALDTLLTDEELRRIMGRRGRRKVKKQYDWESVCDRVLSVYEEIC